MPSTHVEVDGGPPAIAALLAALLERGVAAIADGSAVVVALEGPAVYDLVRDSLDSSGAALRRMNTRTRSPSAMPFPRSAS